MTRTGLLVLLLLSASALPGPSEAVARHKLTFPQDGCPAKAQSCAPGEIQCRYIGSPDSIPTYELLYGPAHRKLMEFVRSVKILKSASSSIFAVNSYEGSNYTNCYVFRDPAHTAAKVSLGQKWAALRTNAPLQYKQRIMSAEHEYYTCNQWNAGILSVSARWGAPDGSYVVGTAHLLPIGSMTNPTFAIEAGERE